MENSKKHDPKDRIDFVNEPILEYGNEKKEFDEVEFHPILIQLLEKSIKESEEGKGSTTEEVMKRVKEKYTFFKMSYKIIWQFNAEMTYQSTIEYINFKWNVKEVKKFEELVIENLDRLALDPSIGTFDRNLKIYFFLISKQTTLYYSINQNSKIVNLLVFWNNQKNPNDLMKLL